MLQRVVSLLSVWALILLLGLYVYSESVLALSHDQRLTWCVPYCVGAFLLGHFVSLFRQRWRARKSDDPPAQPLGWDRHAIAIAVLMVSIGGMSHVTSHSSVQAVLMGVPPVLAFWFPLLSFLAPIVIRKTAGSVDAADQMLITGIGITAMSGAMFFLEPSAALLIGLTAAIMQLGAGGRPPRFTLFSVLIAGVLILFFCATVYATNPLPARRSMTWLGAVAALGFAIAARKRDSQGWRNILAAPVVVAVVMAISEIILTADMARYMTLSAALDTRVVLFRRHPNFVAPFYAFTAVLSIGLVAARARRSFLLWLVPPLLAYSTWRTDSNTGLMALAFGVTALVGLRILRAAATRFGGVKVATVVGALMTLVLVGGIAFLQSDSERSLSLVDRGKRSLDYRLDAWNNSMRVVGNHPVLGVGPQTFVMEGAFPSGSRFANEAEVPHPHNVYLYVAQSAGVFAALLFVIWVIGLVAGLLRLSFSPKSDLSPGLMCALLAALLAQLVASMFDLGQAFHTVIPWPVLIATGLFLSRDEHPDPLPARAAPAFWAAALALGFVVFGVFPMQAHTLMRRAQILGLQFSASSNAKNLRHNITRDLREARELDSTLPVHELLAKQLYEQNPSDDSIERILRQRLELTPDDGAAFSKVGRFYFARGDHEKAAEFLAYGEDGLRGAVDPNGDRARWVISLAALKRFDDVEEALRKSIEWDHEIIRQLQWVRRPEGQVFLSDQRGKIVPVDLREILDEMGVELKEQQLAGNDAGRRKWMDYVYALITAELPDRARDAFDFIEQHVPSVERHSLLWVRAQLAESAGQLQYAADLYREVQELEPHPYHYDQLQMIEARVAGNEVTVEPRAFEPVGGLLIFRVAYEVMFEKLVAQAVENNRKDEARDYLELELFFVNGLVERSQILLRKARFERQLRDPEAALASLEQSMTNLWSRKSLKEEEYSAGSGGSLPARIASEMRASFQDLQMSEEDMLESLDETPFFLAYQPVSNEFRMAFLARLGRHVEALEEAELVLLQSPDDAVAIQVKKASLKGMGLLDELGRFTRHMDFHPSVLEKLVRRP